MDHSWNEWAGGLVMGGMYRYFDGVLEHSWDDFVNESVDEMTTAGKDIWMDD